MAFNLPAAQYLMDENADDNRGSFDTAFQTGRKSGGNLPITDNATQVQNSSGNRGIYFGMDSQASTSAKDASSETKLLLTSVQFNAPNRIQVETLAQRGIVARLVSGAGSSNYREYRIGGNDTPFASAQAGPVTICLDLSAGGQDGSGGAYSNASVTGWGFGTSKLNIVGTNSNLSFFQRVFLFDTEKGGANLPTFTGLSNFDDALAVVQGSNYTNKIGAWLTKSGSSFFVPIPFSFGDGASAINFDDQGAAVVSPADNATGQENFRLTTDAMRVYLDTRDDAADTVVLSGSYSWGTAAPWDFSQNNAGTCSLLGNFNGMGEFTLGSSVRASGVFSLASGSDVVVQGADIDTITVNGNCRIEGSAITAFEGITVTGALNFDTAGTYTVTNSNIGEVTNTSGGIVTLNVDNNTTISTNTGPDINIILPPKSVTVTDLIVGSRVQIFNVTTGTEISNGVAVSSTFTYTLTGSEISTGDTVRVRATQQNGVTASLPLEALGVFGVDGVSIIGTQSPDLIYNSFGIDGSLVTKFNLDFSNVQIDYTVASDFTAQELYAWWVYSITSNNGIRDFFGGITAVDLANIRINNSVVNIFFDTTTNFNILQTDNVRLFREDEQYPVINPTTGGGAIDVVWRDKVFVVQLEGINDIIENQQVINNGVKKASLLQPHSDDLPNVV